MRGDINLLPKKRANEITKLSSGVIVAIIIVILISVVFLIYRPTMKKLNIQSTVSQKEMELSTYTATQDEYIAVTTKLNLLKNRINAFANINNNNISKTLLLEDIESAIPSKILIDNISLFADTLMITGSLDTNEPALVSQFMVNLRNIERVTKVSLDYYESVEDGGSTETDYTFSLTVTYFMEDLEETTQEEEEIAENNDDPVDTEEGAE